MKGEVVLRNAALPTQLQVQIQRRAIMIHNHARTHTHDQQGKPTTAALLLGRALCLPTGSQNDMCMFNCLSRPVQPDHTGQSSNLPCDHIIRTCKGHEQMRNARHTASLLEGLPHGGCTFLKQLATLTWRRDCTEPGWDSHPPLHVSRRLPTPDTRVQRDDDPTAT